MWCGSTFELLKDFRSQAFGQQVVMLGEIRIFGESARYKLSCFMGHCILQEREKRICGHISSEYISVEFNRSEYEFYEPD